MDDTTSTSCEFSGKQHAEMMEILRHLSKNSHAVEQLFLEGDKVLGTGNNVLRAAWRQDVTERLQFEKDQSRSGMNVCVCVHVRVRVCECACTCIYVQVD